MKSTNKTILALVAMTAISLAAMAQTTPTMKSGAAKEAQPQKVYKAPVDVIQTGYGHMDGFYGHRLNDAGTKAGILAGNTEGSGGAADGSDTAGPAKLKPKS